MSDPVVAELRTLADDGATFQECLDALHAARGSERYQRMLMARWFEVAFDLSVEQLMTLGSRSTASVGSPPGCSRSATASRSCELFPGGSLTVGQASRCFAQFLSAKDAEEV